MAKPRIFFKEGVTHYQTIGNKGWTSPVSYVIQHSGWVTVTYEDGAVVTYPPTVIDMIIDHPAARN